MRVPISWLREFAPVPADQSGRAIAARLIAAGLEVETVDTVGAGVTGPLVVGRVLDIEELTDFKKPIRFCRVEVGAGHGHPDTPGVRGIVCGARNFSAGDLVVVALPGSVLPGDFAISSRTTYGRVSDGMICSERELGLGDDYDGILVLPPDSAEPGADVTGLLGIGDEVLDIAVTPDRGYALSVRGVAREAATAYSVAFTDPGLELAELPVAEAEPHVGRTDDPERCDLFSLRTIMGFDPAAPTPMWMRTRLTAAGMRPVSLAVDVTNYVMLETGQPLHAFDLDRLSGPVRARAAAPGEHLVTLDHVDRALDPDDLVIADDRAALGLAGVMGGLTSEISDTTTNIALEAAHFDPGAIARMARRHKLSSEASRRFERGVDPALAPFASERAAALLLRHGGGTHVGLTAQEVGHRPVVITIEPELFGRVAGMPVAADTVREKLLAVGCEISESAGAWQVTPPSWRPDLTDPNDLVEEVLRLVGYDAIPSHLPAIPAQHGLPESRRLRRSVGTALAGAGYVEVPSYPFVGEGDLLALGITPDDPRHRSVVLANPLSDEQPWLRTTLLPGLVAAARRNLSRGADHLALFEQGLVFLPRSGFGSPESVRPSVEGRPSDAELAALDALLPDQPRHVAVLLSGAREPAGWWGPERPVSWADAIGAARLVARAVGASLEVIPGEQPPWHPGRCAVLRVSGNPVGYAGELHPKVCEATGLPPRTAAMELDLDAVMGARTAVTPAPQVGTMPVAKEDIAVVVDAVVTAAEVERALRAGAGDLLESVRLFDEYVGAQVGDGRKSLAFALRFRAPDRTLTADEVSTARDAAVAAATQAVGATLRA
ncbi:MAG: phenylalanine--tRNA ligase subunit beta [Candidatus Nanopelagicales bacterium]